MTGWYSYTVKPFDKLGNSTFSNAVEMCIWCNTNIKILNINRSDNEWMLNSFGQDYIFYFKNKEDLAYFTLVHGLPEK